MIHYEYIGERGKALAEKISGALGTGIRLFFNLIILFTLWLS